MDGKENIIRAMLSLMGVAVGVMLTYFTAISGHATQLARLSEQIAAMKALLADHASMQYTVSSARADFQRVQQQIDAHSVAIEKLDANQRRHEEIFHDLRKRKDE